MNSFAEWERFRRALSGQRLPAMVVDLDALEHNVRVVLGRLDRSPVSVRIATKSIRVPSVLDRLLDLGRGRIKGLMTYSAHETAALASRGYNDFLLAYPPSRPDEALVLADLVERGVRVSVVVDSPEHIRLLGDAAAKVDVDLPVCIDLDVSWRPLRGSIHLGVRRSPIRDVHAALHLAEIIERVRHVRLVGLMAYEAQVAGIREVNPTSRTLDPMRRMVKAQSIPFAAARRAETVAALEARGHTLSVVNGGGTGSLGSTPNDRSVTEVTVGSGFFCPHLFDHYEGLDFRPAALFALAVTRRSDPDHVTCFGGGYIASGPAGADRLPTVHVPVGLTPVEFEGFGEVQTPFKVQPGCPELQLGDPILCRHAKSGELAERFQSALLLRGEHVEEDAPTYRGLGIAVG